MVAFKSPGNDDQHEDHFTKYLATLRGSTLHYFPGASDIDGAIANLALYDLFHRFGLEYVTHSSLDALTGDLVLIGPGDHMSEEEFHSVPSRFESLIRNNLVVFVPQNTMRFDDIARLSIMGATIFCKNTLSLRFALMQGAVMERTHLANDLTVHLSEEHTQASKSGGSGTLTVGGIDFCNVFGRNVERSVISAYHHSNRMTSREFCRSAVQSLVSLLQYYDKIVTDRPSVALLAASLNYSVILYCDSNDSQGSALDDSMRSRFPTLTIQTELATIQDAESNFGTDEQDRTMPPLQDLPPYQVMRVGETGSPRSLEEENSRLKSMLFENQRRAESIFEDQQREISTLLNQRRAAEDRVVRDTFSAEEQTAVAAGRSIRGPRFVSYRTFKQRLSQLEENWEERLVAAERKSQEILRKQLVAAERNSQETLRTKLKDAQAREAAAYRMAKSAWQGISARHRELGRQATELEVAADEARAEVVRLASEAAKLYDIERTMAQAFNAKQANLSKLLDDGRMDVLAQGNAATSLGWTRRWRRRAESYESLVGRIVELSSEVNRAHYEQNVATEQRRLAEDLALKAEPNASELASAAVVLRGEYSATEELIASLEQYSAWADEFQLYDYSKWVDLYDTLTDLDRHAIKARMTRLVYKPLISVLMPVYKPPLPLLRKAIESVTAQLYEHWELCIADDASPDPDVCELLQSFSDADKRIKFVRRDRNGHIAAASNSALSLATGEFIALLDHDDTLAEQALFEVVLSLNNNPELDLIYTDEDHIDENDVRSNPYFKTDYNQALMLGHNLINHLGVYRRSLVETVGGFRIGYEGSQDYDLALRVIDATKPEKTEHIPAVLYHWRSNARNQTFSEAESQRCISSARQALSDHLDRVHQTGEVKAHPSVPSWHLIRRATPNPAPFVSIIVPTKDKPEILSACIDGLLTRTTYPNFEIIIVDHQSTTSATLQLFEKYKINDRIRIISYDGPFNYSAINNFAVTKARGTILALLNNDVDVISEAWLDEMVALAVLPDVGAVGAKLLYPDGRVQHAGVVLGPGGVAGHLFHLLGADDPGYFGRAVLTSDVAAVTAACLVVRKTVFEEVEGFDDVNLPIAFNDVDLCLKIRQRGYRNVWNPQACLYHHESISRGSDQVEERVEGFNAEINFMLQKWEGVLENDPYYNPNLNLTLADFSMAFPPRRRRPWRNNDIALSS